MRPILLLLGITLVLGKGRGRGRHEKHRDKREKIAELVEACPRETEVCGIFVPTEDEMNERPNWKDLKARHDCLGDISLDSVTDECAEVLERMQDHHRRKMERSHRGHRGYADVSDFKEKMLRKITELVEACPQETINCGVTVPSSEEFDNPDWDKMRRQHECMDEIDLDLVNDQCAEVIGSMRERHHSRGRGRSWKKKGSFKAKLLSKIAELVAVCPQETADCGITVPTDEEFDFPNWGEMKRQKECLDEVDLGLVEEQCAEMIEYIREHERDHGRRGWKGDHAHDWEVNPGFKERVMEKVAVLVAACPAETEACGVVFLEEGDFENHPDWKEMKERHRCMSRINIEEVSEECAEALQELHDEHSRHHKSAEDYIARFQESVQGQWMGKKKQDFVEGLLLEGDVEFEFWKEQLLSQCPWYRMMQAKLERGEIEDQFPFLEQLKSKDGLVWSGGDYNDEEGKEEVMEYFPKDMMYKKHKRRHWKEDTTEESTEDGELDVAIKKLEKAIVKKVAKTTKGNARKGKKGKIGKLHRQIRRGEFPNRRQSQP